MSIEANWAGDNGDITPEQAQQIVSLMLQTIQFDYEPPIPMIHPVGAIQMFGGDTAPDEWLFCNGDEVSRSTYADLFAVIGEAYGAGDGTTTFLLPNFIQRSPMGTGGAVVGYPGNTDGEFTVTLASGHLPSHTHGVNDPGHTHVLQSPFTSIIGARPAGGAAASAGTSLSGGAQLTTNTTGITIQSTGANAAHNNLHPVLGVPFIIFAGI